MTPHQALAVTVRIVAIWFFLYFATTIFGNYFYARVHDVNSSLLIPVASTAIVAFLSVLLWVFPMFIANKILPAISENPTQTPLFESWFSVGCSLIGLFALSKSIPALASYFIRPNRYQLVYRGTDEKPDYYDLKIESSISRLLDSGNKFFSPVKTFTCTYVDDQSRTTLEDWKRNEYEKVRLAHEKFIADCLKMAEKELPALLAP